MTRENTKAYAKKRRFPRLNVSNQVKRVERLLHVAYNKTARGKNYQLRNYPYDVYKTKIGWKAKYQFTYLAQKLIDNNIDPALYIKVMSRFGKFKSLRYMPQATWLNKNKQIRRFKWFYKSEMKCYPLKLDFKKALNGWDDLDVYASIRESASLLKAAVDKTGIGFEEALVMLHNELSPWFLQLYISLKDTWKDYRKVNEYMRRNSGVRKHITHIGKKALKRSGIAV